MTQLLERAVKKARSLPEEDQNSVAAIILEEIEDEVRWDQAFANSQDMLAKLASEAMEEDRAGKTQELDLGRL
ncbi:hypothetical protein [Candidatus Thiosymbion oneisti]|uniref:hypothetical protein n=1 Tax=Candidatus Thiosymbion oneisti TaxID=589554 RepID=UPI000B7D2B7F|nr:hypothetical protein [Candidatus Thiosymbion oneisti]